MSITNASGDDAYPASAFVYVLVYAKQADAAKGKAAVDFLKWAITDGQKYAGDLHYATLPDKIQKMTMEKLESIK
jgi:phosphate transport system substrate-binding protein